MLRLLDEVMDLFYSLKSPYRKKATFVMKEDKGSSFALTRKSAGLSYGISCQERMVNL